MTDIDILPDEELTTTEEPKKGRKKGTSGNAKAVKDGEVSTLLQQCFNLVSDVNGAGVEFEDSDFEKESKTLTMVINKSEYAKRIFQYAGYFLVIPLLWSKIKLIRKPKPQPTPADTVQINPGAMV